MGPFFVRPMSEISPGYIARLIAPVRLQKDRLDQSQQRQRSDGGGYGTNYASLPFDEQRG